MVDIIITIIIIIIISKHARGHKVQALLGALDDVAERLGGTSKATNTHTHTHTNTHTHTHTTAWLRTSGVDANGAAARVRNSDRLGEKVRPGTFGNTKAG